MNDLQHNAIATWERRWLAVAGLMSLVFVMLIAFSLATEGTHIARRSGRTTPEQLTSHELFANPGVRQLTNRKFQVTLVAQTFNFTPSEITLPVGSDVSFYLTSRDVLHGFQLQGTNINVELIPGEISTINYTFNKIGTYTTVCNEYCGISHQNMLGVVNIVSSSDYGRYVQARDAASLAALQEGALGEAIYTVNCVSCHQANGQGLAGVFPPLAGHTPELLAADRSYLPKVLLYGLQGSINVLGDGYNGAMPAWSQLTNEEIADTLNYILSAWGNDAVSTDFTPYSAEEIAAARDLGLSANDVYDIRKGLALE